MNDSVVHPLTASRFSYSDDDLEHAVRALVEDLDLLPELLREERWAQARTDAETVLKSAGGEYTDG